MAKKLLFMCPHNAAKSILAESYAKKIFKEKGFTSLIAISKGTEPDSIVCPQVLKKLNDEGYREIKLMPEKFSQEDLMSANKIISIGCDTSNFISFEDKLINWNDVPATDLDLEKSAKLIYNKTLVLISEMA